jgi:hypothetical protein
MCFAKCKDMGKVLTDNMSGGVPEKPAFHDCIEVDKKPFQECLEQLNHPMMLRACSAKEACRDDYACMRVKNGPLDRRLHAAVFRVPGKGRWPSLRRVS